MKSKELKKVLADHNLWLARSGGKRADLTMADLTWDDLSGANLRGAVLTRANLLCADLTGADLTGADLSGADLTWDDLADAKLTDADLTDADLTDANLAGAVGNLREVRTLQIAHYKITYTSTRLWIGCKSGTIQDWADGKIDLYGRYLALWQEHGQWLLDTIKRFPATPCKE